MQEKWRNEEMADMDKNQIEVEEKESEMLKKLYFIIKDNLEIFNSKLEDSMRYIYYITLPIIMASTENKSFNPFSEIIEKHISYIINNKMIALGYKMLPLGYSSDLSFEDKNFIIQLDVKTANINNPADYKEEIALGFDQTSYPGKLPLGVRGTDVYNQDGIKEVKTYPNLPSEYLVNGVSKLCLTYGLIFIYPNYKDALEYIKEEYKNIRKFLDGKLVDMFKDVFSDTEIIKQFLDYQPKKERTTRRELIVENLVRAYYIHNKRELNLGEDENKKLDEFAREVVEVSDKLAQKEIKPVAIILISIPNGKLSPHYDEEIVSGKSFGKSIRYHYDKGKFKGLNGKSRVIFIFYDKKYLDNLKKYFPNITTYDVNEKEN